MTKHKSYRIMSSVQTLRSGVVADFNGQERGRTVQALPDGQGSHRGAVVLKSSKPDGCPVTDGKCHALCVESRWYHGLLFALSLMAQGVLFSKSGKTVK